MTKPLHFILSLVLGMLALGSIGAQAQAPANILGRGVVLTISNGAGSLYTGNGTVLFLAGATGTTFGDIGLNGTNQAGEGTYTYTVTGANTARVNYNDSISGIPGFIVNLTSTSATTGNFVLTNSNITGSQSGTYRLFNGIAPTQVKGFNFHMNVIAGISPLATSGAQLLSINPNDTFFTLQSSAGDDVGSANYTKSNTYASLLSLTGSSNLYGATITWDTATTGAYLLSTPGGAFQAGTFTATLPPYTGLQFQNGNSLGALEVGSDFLPTGFAGVGGLSGWTESAVADVNGDGIPDLIFQSAQNIAVLEISANGLPQRWVGVGNVGGTWKLDAAADIDGDGQVEFLFEDTTGNVAALTVSTSETPVAWHGIGNPGSAWKLRGAADIDGNGHPELLFQNGTSLGALSVSTTFVATAWHGMGVMPTSYTLGFTTDLDSDGHPDLIFQSGSNCTLSAESYTTGYAGLAFHGIGAMGTGWKLPGAY